MIVLSLFDGISVGQLALNRAGIKYDKYFASEIDKYAIKVTQQNFPNTIQLGDVKGIKKENLPQIDLLIGGSPCQGFSKAGKQLNFSDPRSSLFFEFVRLLEEIKPKYFLLENVKMKEEWRNIISSYVGVKPLYINSALVSAQNRPRWYWTNIPDLKLPVDRKIYLQNILETEVDDKYYIKSGRLEWLKNFGEVKEKRGFVSFNPDKAKCLTARAEPSRNTTYIVQWPRGTNDGGIRGKDGKAPTLTTSCWQWNNLLSSDGYVRRLTPVECERLQTVPDGFTSCISDHQRYKVLGNSWTAEVITHIFGGLN